MTFSPEDFAEGRNLLIGMVSSGSGPALVKELAQQGEKLQLGVWLNLFLLKRGAVGRALVKGIMGAAVGQRQKSAIQEVRMRSNEEYEHFLK